MYFAINVLGVLVFLAVGVLFSKKRDWSAWLMTALPLLSLTGCMFPR